MVLYTGKAEKARVNITLDKDLLCTIRKKAEFEERSLSGYINRILRIHLARLDLQQRKNATDNGTV